ncbi:MAG: TIGR02996 domain-containing protein [Gemmataceae bacterium]|nr:TIGR02996 domain-containing protein [Gemmataceae bacterium]
MTLATDLPALLNACKADPLDDAPRRVLADWLEEHGDLPRAEFVRLQLLPAEPGEDWFPDQAAQRAQEVRLLRRFALPWAGGYPTHSCWFAFDPGPYDEDEDGQRPQARFERGLLKVAAPAQEMAEVLDRLPEHAVPWLETADLRDVGDHNSVREMFAHPRIASFTSFELGWDEGDKPAILDWLDRDHVRRLNLASDEGGDVWLRRLAATRSLRPHELHVSPAAEDMSGWAALMAAPLLSEVRSLECSIPSETPALALLARAAHLARLTKLHLSGDDFPDSAMRELFSARGAAGLVELSVGGYSGNISGIAAALADSPVIRRLEDLDLGFNAVGEAEARALARSPVAQTLRSLSFSSGELEPGGARALAESPLLAGLESLDLSCAGIGDEGLIALARSPYLSKLRRLSVCRCGITAAGLKALTESRNLAGLQELDVSINPLSPTALDALATSSQFGNLRSLGLRQLKIDPMTFQRLLRSAVAGRLEKLDLQGAPLIVAHVKALAESPTLGGLRELVLYSNPIPRGAIDGLLKAPWVPNLVRLTLNGTGLTDKGVEALTRHPVGLLADLDLGGNAVGNRGAELLLAWPGLSQLVAFSVYSNPVDEALSRRLEAAFRGGAATGGQ